MKLLLAIDDSEHSQVAVKQVSAHFNPQTTEIRVLHVLTPATYATPPQMSHGYAPEMEELEQEARFRVEDSAKKLRIAGFRVDAVVLTGDTRSRIL